MKSEIVLFDDGNVNIEVQVSPDQETVWLTQAQMAALFDVSTDNISLHIKNILNEGELENKFSTSRIEKANKIKFVNTAYSDMKVSNCTNLLEADLKYSDLTATMISDTPYVDINSMYSDAVIHLKEDAIFNYSFETSYSDISFKGFFDTETIGTSGNRGNGESGHINVEAKYSDVKFRKIK